MTKKEIEKLEKKFNKLILISLITVVIILGSIFALSDKIEDLEDNALTVNNAVITNQNFILELDLECVEHYKIITYQLQIFGNSTGGWGIIKTINESEMDDDTFYSIISEEEVCIKYNVVKK